MIDYHDGSDTNYKITRKNMSTLEKKVLKFLEDNQSATVSDIAGNVGCRTYWAQEKLEFLVSNGYAIKLGDCHFQATYKGYIPGKRPQ